MGPPNLPAHLQRPVDDFFKKTQRSGHPIMIDLGQEG